ncbi:hypothetical protein [Qipengyuania profunda]|jgi:hypothetical protein|uniref:hypothetical protein n=1 Tax=Qipengyuania profunda TaxID=3113984 RepID=UPI002A186C6D|nr:hypothetical protein [Qipengyuania sp. HL-TH1]WPL56075.1 hypothetical protein SD421_11410 [Qipengyuania sp. HL-TH5]
MFIGHFAPALLARGITEDAPKLGVLFIAAQLVDWAFFTFAIFGIEQLRIVPGITAMNPYDLVFMPYSHSLLATAGWALVFGVVVGVVLRNMVAAAWGVIVVLSHWLLDLLVHRPDLTIAGGEDKHGLGLWNTPHIEMPLEIGLVLLAYWFYISRTKGPVIPPLILLGAMLLFQAINWFGPQPETAGVGMYLSVFLSYGILTAMAFWVQSTRWHKNQRGLAVAG